MKSLDLNAGIYLGSLPVSGVFLGSNRVSGLATPGRRNGIAKQPLPADTAVATGSAAAVQALVDQAALSGSYQTIWATAPPALDLNNFSAAYAQLDHSAAAALPLTRVKVTSPGSALEAAIGDAGIRFPAGFSAKLEHDSDGLGVLYFPGEIRGPGLSGVYYDFVGLDDPTAQQALDGYGFQCRELCRIVDADNSAGQMYEYDYQVGAHYDDPTSDPYAVPDQRNGVMQYPTWGAFALGANPPVINHILLPEDLRRGYADHVVGLLVADCGVGSVFPGIIQRYDGTLANYPVQDGYWFRFPASATMPTNLSPLGEVLWRSIQRHGLIIADKTHNCLAVRALPECGPLLVADSPIDGRDWSAWPFTNFPWSGLELTVAGSLNEYHPRSVNKVTTGIGALADWQIWLDPSQAGGLADSAAVPRELDYSGKGRDAFAYGAAPIYKTNVIGGHPVIRYNGTGQGQSFAALDLKDFTAVVVQITIGDSIIVAAPRGYAQLLRLGDYGAGLRYLYADDDGIGSGTGYADVRSSVVSVARASASIITCRRSGSTISWFENGASKGTATLGPAGVAGTRFGQIMNAPAAAVFCAGDRGDLAIAGEALSDGVLSSVHAALGAKYGIAVV